jgi:hypothetical protein
MVFENSRVYYDGVEIDAVEKEKIHKIIKTLKSMIPSADISLRLLKWGDIYEGLLWGKAEKIPIGIYKRAPTMSLVLENLERRVRRECIRLLKLRTNHPQTTVAS